MAITHADLQSFQVFAADQISSGNVDSLQELVDKWNSRRQHLESVEAIRGSIAQSEAGETLPVSQAFDEVRKKLGWSK